MLSHTTEPLNDLLGSIVGSQMQALRLGMQAGQDEIARLRAALTAVLDAVDAWRETYRTSEPDEPAEYDFGDVQSQRLSDAGRVARRALSARNLPARNELERESGRRDGE